MKNVKKIVLSLLLGSACVLGGHAKAMLTDDEVGTFLTQLPATFDPNKATLEDFQEKHIREYKLITVGCGQGCTSVLRIGTPHRRSASTVEECRFITEYQRIGVDRAYMGMKLVFARLDEV